MHSIEDCCSISCKYRVYMKFFFCLFVVCVCVYVCVWVCVCGCVCVCVYSVYEISFLSLLWYSRTSDNGPSEKRTTSLQRTHSLLRTEITIVIVLKQPPRNGRFSIPDSGQELHSQLHFSIQNCL